MNYIVVDEKIITQCRLSQCHIFFKIIWRFQVRLLSFIQKINISFLNQSTSYDIKYKEEMYFFGSSEIDIQELMGATLSITVIKAESWFFYKFIAEHDFLLQYRASNSFKKNTILKVWKAHNWTIKRTGTFTNTFYVTFLKRIRGTLTKRKTENTSKFLCKILKEWQRVPFGSW